MKVVPSGRELTILGTLSVGCKVTCAQETKLNRKNASRLRIMKFPIRLIARPILSAGCLGPVPAIITKQRGGPQPKPSTVGHGFQRTAGSASIWVFWKEKILRLSRRIFAR